MFPLTEAFISEALEELIGSCHVVTQLFLMCVSVIGRRNTIWRDHHSLFVCVFNPETYNRFYLIHTLTDCV